MTLRSPNAKKGADVQELFLNTHSQVLDQSSNMLNLTLYDKNKFTGSSASFREWLTWDSACIAALLCLMIPCHQSGAFFWNQIASKRLYVSPDFRDLGEHRIGGLMNDEVPGGYFSGQPNQNGMCRLRDRATASDANVDRTGPDVLFRVGPYLDLAICRWLPWIPRKESCYLAWGMRYHQDGLVVWAVGLYAGWGFSLCTDNE